MIYETAVVVKSQADDATIKKIQEVVEQTISQFKGELILKDDWGVKTFAQNLKSGEDRGRYIYFMYKCSQGDLNKELGRLFGINESIFRYIFIKLGEDRYQENFAKNYKNPKYDVDDEKKPKIDTSEKEKKNFTKKRSCYFSANKTQPDWKYPLSYSWLVNEFGKITPGRMTGLTPRFQRMANEAIKRGRTMGMIGFVSNTISQ